MVTIEQLEALDLLIWLRSGGAAAESCICDESSISRRVRTAVKTLGLQLNREKEFVLVGDSTLLRLQRIVHQHARFLGHRPLRLDSTHYIRDQLTDPALQGWLLGPCHHRGYGALLSLLEERVIDAWITSDLQDLPDSKAFAVIPLWEWPGELVVNNCHPLAREHGLKRVDLERFPSLVLPEDLYPGLTRIIQAKGFGRGSRPDRYDQGSWDRQTADAVTITYGSCLSLDLNSSLTRLDWDLGLTGGEALIILSEWLDQPSIAMLLDDLRARQMLLQRRLPQLVGKL